jgi:septal ring factor EnvC (AmiA/AmiB activator)
MTISDAAQRDERRSAVRSPWTVVAAVAVLPLTVAAATAQSLPEDAVRQELRSVDDELRSSQDRLEAGRDLEQALKDREQAAAKELGRYREQLRTATTDKRRTEQEQNALKDEIEALDRDEAIKQTALRRRLVEEGAMLGLILRVARLPPEAMIALPASPIDTVRTIIVAHGARDWLGDQAGQLKAALVELEALRVEKAEKHAMLTATTTTLAAKTDALRRRQQEARGVVDRWTEKWHDQAEQNRVQAKRNRELAAQAKDLRDLIDRLEKDRDREAEAQRAAEAARQAEEAEARHAEEAARPAEAAPQQHVALVPPPPPKPPAEGAVGAPQTVPAHLPRPPGIQNFDSEAASLFPPIQGKIVRQYGAKDEFGAASKGLVIETRAGAEVVAPFDGQVVFAGPFRGYGQILLIEHGGGYHTLLAGVGRIDSVLGQWLLAGEPVAVMSEPESGRSRLYVEFRRNGQPINPLPWMAAGQSKVNG